MERRGAQSNALFNDSLSLSAVLLLLDGLLTARCELQVVCVPLLEHEGPLPVHGEGGNDATKLLAKSWLGAKMLLDGTDSQALRLVFTSRLCGQCLRVGPAP